MKYSSLFGKTIRKPPAEARAVSHKLLYQAGYIRDLVAGRYSFLPLGFKVWNKIVGIIEQEMSKIGSSRIGTPALHPMELWKATARDQAFGAGLMKLEDRRGAGFALGATAEGVMLDLVNKFKPSYRDLPIVIHQFSRKFRDELRARGGLLRTREFVMKDAYSFHDSKKSLDKTYQEMYKAYERIMERLGIQGVAVEAYSGAIGGKHCHEFMIKSSAGEDSYLTCSECKYTANKEKAEFVRKDINSKDKIKKMEIVSQPEWVETMKDNVKHYKLPESRFLKNVVYKTSKGKIIIAVIRGDLEVNEIKLSNLLDQDLIPAEEKDLIKMGTKSGWVHSWGHKAYYVGDVSLKTVKNLIGGQKEKSTDTINVNYSRDFKVGLEADIALAENGFECGKCEKGVLKETKSIEFGHVFKLDDFYTKAMDGMYIDKKGKKRIMYMGSYGIGIGRAMATIVEKNNDKNGIVWPESVAPFQVHLIGLDLKDSKVKKQVEKTYSELVEKKIEVLYDAREDVSAGIKFSDADLIGIPVRLVVSKKTGDMVEVKKRSGKKVELLDLEKIVRKINI